MKFDDNELYSIPSSVNGTQCSLHNLAKWKNGLAFKKINFSDEGVPVIKIAELNNGIGPTTAYTKEIFSEDERVLIEEYALQFRDMNRSRELAEHICYQEEYGNQDVAPVVIKARREIQEKKEEHLQQRKR